MSLGKEKTGNLFLSTGGRNLAQARPFSRGLGSVSGDGAHGKSNQGK